jgi:hypothetical protein
MNFGDLTLNSTYGFCSPINICFFAVTGPGKLTVGKLYGGILIYEIWKTTRFSNLEILAKMEQEMATKLEKVSQLTEQLT